MRTWISIAVLFVACEPSETMTPADGDVRTDGGGRPRDGGPSRDAGRSPRDADGTDTAYIPMPGSCGLEAPAFCDTFEAGPIGGTRVGELDGVMWSGARISPLDITAGGRELWVGPWRTPIWPREPLPCRGDTPTAWGFVETDTLICDPTSQIGSRHLFVAAATQNYGLNAYRIRQPFDFGARTGTIVFDADLTLPGLNAWSAITVSEDPTPAPSFDAYERGSGPRNGVEIQFQSNGCHPTPGASVTVRRFIGYDETVFESPPGCALTEFGALNHVEVEISDGHLRVTATDYAEDGLSFGTPHVLFDDDVSLGFSRGYVTLAVHNHATIKYESGAASYVRWDNVGFDGPRDDAWREYSVPHLDRHTTVTQRTCVIEGVCGWPGEMPECIHCLEGPQPVAGCTYCETTIEGVELGYELSLDEGSPLALTLDSVVLTGMARARLVMTAFNRNDRGSGISQTSLRFRINGGAWHDRPLDDEEIGSYMHDNAIGTLNQIIALPFAELVEGRNVIELVGVTPLNGDGPAVTNVDLVLTP